MNTSSKRKSLGRSMNIYFQPEIYDRLREVAPSREISKLINSIASEYLDRNYNERERIKQSLINSTKLRRKSQQIKEINENISSSSLNDFTTKRK